MAPDPREHDDTREPANPNDNLREAERELRNDQADPLGDAADEGGERR